MSFLTEYDALATLSDPGERARKQAGMIREWLQGRTQELFAELRASRPILVGPGIACVAGFDDVLEVLSRDRVFSVRPYAARMERTTGAFFLGMARTPQYDRELAIVRLAAPREDLGRIRDLAAGQVTQLTDRARPAGRLELVNGYARVVATRIVQHYFGVPGPDDPTLMNWLRVLFRDIFINLGDDPAVRQAADSASAQMADYLRRLIADRRGKLPPASAGNLDVLARLLLLQREPATALDDDGIRRNLGGLIVGAVDTTSRAFVQAVDQLLSRPEALALATQAAGSGDDALLARCVWEGMRFNPQNPFLYRLCEEAYTLAAGTPRAAVVPAGTLVFAGTQSAMADPARVPQPEAFRADRPPETYLFFGFGLHACFGQFIAPLLFVELARSLLALPGLRRATGTAGTLVYDGPFPDSLWVEFDA